MGPSEDADACKEHILKLIRANDLKFPRNSTSPSESGQNEPMQALESSFMNLDPHAPLQHRPFIWQEYEDWKQSTEIQENHESYAAAFKPGIGW
jgi:hypothetical protein